MGRFRTASADDDGETGIDISPLIDCVFILLIFFIVTTVFVEETGVKVDKPQAASASDLESNSILIAVTADNDVIYGKENIGISRVQSTVKRLLAAEPGLPVIIQADRNADVGTFARVLDEATFAGAETVNLASSIPGS